MLTLCLLLLGNETYLESAHNIASGAINQLAVPNKGILTDIGWPGAMDATGAQFKGIFARNLGYLQAESGRQEYVTFLQDNANTIWNDNRQKDGQFGALWQGPIKSLSAAAQASALDCLIAAAAVSPSGYGGDGGSVSTYTTVATVTMTSGPAKTA